MLEVSGWRYITADRNEITEGIGMTRVVENWSGGEFDATNYGSVTIWCVTAPITARNIKSRATLTGTATPQVAYPRSVGGTTTSIDEIGGYDTGGFCRISLDGSGGTFILMLA